MDRGSGTMMCYECEKEFGTSENDAFGFCACCGLRIEVENSIYMEDQIYCADCFDNIGAKCADCGDYYLSKSFFTEDEYKEENVCTFVDPINSGGNIYEKKEVKYTYKYCPKGHKHLILKTE